MDLSKIITVAGKTGLFRIVAQGRNALIVEPLAKGARTAVPASVRVSTLEEISMFTTGDDVPLTDVLTKLHTVEGGKPSLDPKSSTEDDLFAKLGEALPEHDRERIYGSDVRKLFAWYNELLAAGVFKEAAAKEEAEAEKATEAGTAKKAAKGAAKKPKAPAKAASTAAPKPGGASKPKGSTTVRKGSQRGG